MSSPVEMSGLDAYLAASVPLPPADAPNGKSVYSFSAFEDDVSLFSHDVPLGKEDPNAFLSPPLRPVERSATSASEALVRAPTSVPASVPVFRDDASFTYLSDDDADDGALDSVSVFGRTAQAGPARVKAAPSSVRLQNLPGEPLHRYRQGKTAVRAWFSPSFPCTLEHLHYMLNSIHLTVQRKDGTCCVVVKWQRCPARPDDDVRCAFLAPVARIDGALGTELWDDDVLSATWREETRVLAVTSLSTKSEVPVTHGTLEWEDVLPLGVLKGELVPTPFLASSFAHLPAAAVETLREPQDASGELTRYPLWAAYAATTVRNAGIDASLVADRFQHTERATTQRRRDVRRHRQRCRVEKRALTKTRRCSLGTLLGKNTPL